MAYVCDTTRGVLMFPSKAAALDWERSAGCRRIFGAAEVDWRPHLHRRPARSGVKFGTEDVSRLQLMRAIYEGD